ncbi:thymine dioxygenase [Trametes versicolor FP-101664 SS1]|uniref:thymine dioxygenase n=1 Tax=Trametes versicolor (strain FP-101664) TaxID=717944 RepID=UPI000462437C|nr:thymine dioxygenase [Trametes versicolor FP-101664 SS1]EIW59524.1 thymine dioxygenase [Trametes versicolor FP-101664 SS1]
MPSAVLGDAHGIAVLDFGAFLDGSAREDVARAMVDSFKRVGFVYLVNHGIPKDKICTMFDWSKRFFAQPMEVKQLAPHPPSGTHHRGYSAPGVEKVVQHIYDKDALQEVRAKAPDVKESFECGWEESESMPNIWLPDDTLPGFKEACLDFYWTCHETELNILRALAAGLGISEDHLVPYHNAHDCQLRLLHYPSVPAQDLLEEKISRIDAHSDFGSITLLLQDDVGGLEIEDPHNPGQFLTAPPVEGALIVNAGDFMMRWSNDVIRSTVHRVRAPPQMKVVNGMTPERYSIPYFCAPDMSMVVECLPGTYSAEKPPKYEPISAGQYILHRLAASY